MNLQIIPKQNVVPAFDSKAIKIQHIEYYPGDIIEGNEITEQVISELLKQIVSGTSVYLSLVPHGEDNWLEVVSDGTWLALGYSSNFGQDNYYSYNPDFEGIEEMTPLLSEGQSPIEKYFALTDIQAGLKAVEYFIRTGELSPNIDWAKQI
ncbi:MAG: hypothetical protein J1E64_14605 [Acetatifactor sp.]|nr:hypothetical protein [Acetatifactor sp.]